MLTTRIFHPSLSAGKVYARAYQTATALQWVGGLEELTIKIEEDVKKQTDYSQAGGGTRAQVNRIKAVTMGMKMQDWNPVNMARAVFGLTSAVVAGTATNEPIVAYKGGLIRLAHINPSAVIIKKGAAVVTPTGNYEVVPEGILIPDAPSTLVDADALTVDYAHSGYDVIEALTTTAPTLQLVYAGVNEAMDGVSKTLDFFRVKMGAAKNIGLIDTDFGLLELEGEVLVDPSRTGAGISRFFREQMA
nr:hypothetical protein [uncultured Albidiferax sp.]